MPVIQTRNAEAEQLTSPDQAWAERNHAVEIYDNVGGQTYSIGDIRTLNLDTQRYNSAPEVFVLASDILTITEAGYYLFTAQVTTQHNGGSSAVTSRMWLEEDPDTGTFVEVPAAFSFFYSAAIFAAAGTGLVQAVLLVSFDYRYRVRFSEDYGSSSLITIAEGSKLSVVRLFKNG